MVKEGEGKVRPGGWRLSHFVLIAGFAAFLGWLGVQKLKKL